MITAVDTSIIVALWDGELDLRMAAKTALETAQSRGRLVVSAPVFAELLAAPHPDESFLDEFLRTTRIAIDWNLEEAIWRIAGRAFQQYAQRRRKQRDNAVRRILADFVIGAHAQYRGYHLLTLDDHLYSASFPNLALLRL